MNAAYRVEGGQSVCVLLESVPQGNSDLKPCPFCGRSDSIAMVYRQDYGSYYKTGVRCMRCESTLIYESDTDDEREKRRQAIEKWNRRDGTCRRYPWSCPGVSMRSSTRR